MRPSIEPVLRPADEHDRDLFFRLLVDARRSDMEQWGWPEAQREDFLRMQFRAQEAQRHGEDLVVVLDGQDVGRLVVDRDGQRLHLVDIALLSEAQGRGIGTALIQRLMEEAVGTGQPLALSVAQDNLGARRLYRRLGFEVVDEDAMYCRMVWRAPLADKPVARRSVMAGGVVAGGVVAAAATGVVAAAPTAYAAARTGTLLRSSFASLVGQRFTVGASALTLRQVTDPPYVPATLSGKALTTWRDANFLLTFDLVSGPAVSSDVVTASHKRLGSFPVWMARTGPDGRAYDALFNREVPS